MLREPSRDIRRDTRVKRSIAAPHQVDGPSTRGIKTHGGSRGDQVARQGPDALGRALYFAFRGAESCGQAGHARRRFAVYRRSKDLVLAQRFARHASPLTTTIYTHPSDQELW